MDESGDYARKREKRERFSERKDETASVVVGHPDRANSGVDSRNASEQCELFDMERIDSWIGQSREVGDDNVVETDIDSHPHPRPSLPLSPSLSEGTTLEFHTGKQIDLIIRSAKLAEHVPQDSISLVSVTPHSSIHRGLYDGCNVFLKVSAPNNGIVGDVSDVEWMSSHREAFVLRKLSSPNVIRPISSYVESDCKIVVLEDGGNDLSSSRFSKPEDLEQFLNIASQLANGLAAVHDASIIHRDIAPSNIVYNAETNVLKIIDFDVASLMPMTQGRLSNGTIAYMSPEQTGRVNRPTDYRTDFYSLGVTLYELLTGSNPFLGSDTFTTVWNHLVFVPTPVNEILPHVPSSVAKIIDKLLKKSPEERYQSAKALKYDLDLVRRDFLGEKFNEEFVPGLEDSSKMFLISQEFVGRESERRRILDSIDRVRSNGFEILFIGGRSGVGKSALVEQIANDVAEMKGFFISGKYQKQNMDADFSAIVSALKSFVDEIGSQSKDVDALKTTLIAELGTDASLLSVLVPEMVEIFGSGVLDGFNQPNPDEAVRRLRFAIARLFDCIAQPETPLVFFLDDLQWIDSRSVSMLSHLLMEADLKNVLFIGSYRDNEIDNNIECTKLFEEIEESKIYTETISLNPLSLNEVLHLVADTLRLSEDDNDVTQLTSLVFSKSLGNPFFVKALLNELHRLGFINQISGIWRMDFARIQSMSIKQDVSAELGRSIAKRDVVDVAVLGVIACCSITPDCCSSHLICDVLDMEASDVRSALSSLLSSYLVSNIGSYFKCAHDGVQETVFSEMDSARKKHNMVRIARSLKSSSFERIMLSSVEYYCEAVDLIEYPTEAIEVASLALRAARDAKSSTAFGTCKKYLSLGIACLGDDAWKQHYQLCFRLNCELIDIEYVSTNIEEAERLGNVALQKAQSNFDKAALSNLFLVMYTMRGAFVEAVDIGIDALELLGVDFPSPDKISEVVERELKMAEENQGERNFDDLLSSKEMMDDVLKLEMSILLNIDPPLYVTGNPLYAIVVAKMVNLTLRYGVHPVGSPKSFVTYGLILGNIKGQYRRGGEFARLGLKLGDRFGLKSEMCKAYAVFSFWVNHWTQPLQSAENNINVAISTGTESGEIQFVGYARMCKLLNELYVGRRLRHCSDIIPHELHFFRETHNVLGLDTIRGLYLIVSTLLSPYRARMRIKCPDFNEPEYIVKFDDPNRQFALAMYLSAKSKLFYLMGSYEAAQDVAESAIRDMNIFGTCAGLFDTAEFAFYHSLILFSLLHLESSVLTAKTMYLDKIDGYMKMMGHWATGCEVNFFHRSLLLKAEMAAVNVDLTSAIKLFNMAIEQAEENEFALDIAVFWERFGLFWKNCSFDASARSCFNSSYSKFLDLDFVCKYQQMEHEYSTLLDKREKIIGSDSSTPTGTTSAEVTGDLDFNMETITRATQTFVEKSSPSKLLEAAMKILLANAGAQRGVLFLLKEDALVAAAVCETNQTCDLSDIPLSEAQSICCVEMVEDSSKRRTPIIVDDANSDAQYRKNSFCQSNESRSMLSLPIINQAELLGILFLENRSMSGVFSTDILTVLALISSQLAVSLEIAIRFQKLADVNSLLRSSEQRFRVLADSAPVGIALMDSDCHPVYLNQMLTEMTGLNMNNFERLWTDVLHPDYRNRVFDSLSETSLSEHESMAEEMLITSVGGSTKWVTFYLTALFSEYQQLCGSIIVMTDISSQKLLNAAIPKEIVGKMLRKPSLSPHHHTQTINDATIMFADIVGFTRSSEKIVPMMLISQLNRIFSEYDELIDEFNLTRLKIIGDCYMVVGGILENSGVPTHSMRMAKLALRMREISFKHTIGANPIQLRIGICNGPIAAGVIGTTKLVFDVWGRTVNTARRLQESCEIDDICMFSELGSSLKTDLIIGPESLKQISDLGSVIVRCVLGDKLMLRRIVYALLVRLHEYFPRFLEKLSHSFRDLLHSLSVPELISEYYCFDVEQFLSKRPKRESDSDSSSTRILLNESDCDVLYSTIQSIDVAKGINQVLLNGMSVLHLAVRLNCEDAVRWSLYLHADQQLLSQAFSPLLFACKYSDLRIVKFLIQKRKKTPSSEACEFTPMFVAAAFGRTEIVMELFVDQVSAIDNIRTCRGISPMTVASLYGHENVVRLLAAHATERGTATTTSRSTAETNGTTDFGPAFPPLPKLQSVQIRMIAWLMHHKDPNMRKVGMQISPPVPFEFASTVHPAELKFVFSKNCQVPSILLKRGLKVLIFDCGSMCFTAVTALPDCSTKNSDFCVTNCYGSHSKGLETFVFKFFFELHHRTPQLYLPENVIEPLWVGSISGGLSSIEGVSPTIRTFFHVNPLEDGDCFVWEGVRVWLVRTSNDLNLNYHALLFAINDTKVVINPDPGIETPTIRSHYEAANVIFANIAVPNGNGADDAKERILQYPESIRRKMFSFSTEPDECAVGGKFICPIIRDKNFLFDSSITKDIERNVRVDDELRVHESSNVRQTASTFALDISKDGVLNRCSLTFVGAGNAFSNNNTNALVVVDGRRLLLDCGGTYIAAARSIGFPDPFDVDAVYISHLHLDHVGGLVDLALARMKRQASYSKIQLILSSDLLDSSVSTKLLWENCLNTPLSQFGSIYDIFEVVSIPNDDWYDWYGISIQLVRTEHVMDFDRPASTYGLMLQITDRDLLTCGKKVFFTTDTKNVPDVEKYCVPADLIFHDCSFQPNPVHCGIGELRRLRNDIARKIWLMHVDFRMEGCDTSKFQGVIVPGQSFDFTSLRTFASMGEGE